MTGGGGSSSGKSEKGTPSIPSTPVPSAPQQAAAAATATGSGFPTPSDKQHHHTRSSVSSHRSSFQSRRSDTEKSVSLVQGPYAAPWEKYRMELHTFQGELAFREFVEALVRIAHAMYNDELYGTLTHKVTLMVEEHLTPLTCTITGGTPLLPLCREHRHTLTPHLRTLETLFLRYSEMTSLGQQQQNGASMSALLYKTGSSSSHHGGGASPSSPIGISLNNKGQQQQQPHAHAGVTIKVRQFLLMLKESGVFDEKVTVGSVMHKLAVYDLYPKFTAEITKQQYMTTRRITEFKNMSQDVMASTLVVPTSTGSPATPLVAATPSERASSMGDETPRFVDNAAEGLYRSMYALNRRSKGLNQTNLHATICAERELTFAEFIEAVAIVGNLRGADAVSSQRVASFLKGFLDPVALEM